MTIQLPIPDTEAQIRSQQLTEVIKQAIETAAGFITFAEFMQHALYDKQFGYYTSGLRQFGSDFVTAPEISPLFAQCLARQCEQVLKQLKSGVIIEFGAGSGKLAATLLQTLAHLNCLPTSYYILEISIVLQQQQQHTLQTQLSNELYNRIQWLTTLPDAPINGVILANEVLDAMPVHRFHTTIQGIVEIGVGWQEGQFIWQSRSITDSQLQTAIETLTLPPNYTSEINILSSAWIHSISACLHQGMILLIDYGFPRHEYYHPQRSEGTIMCHYQQYTHDNPLILIGLQDITAHVDFTTIAETAVAADLQVAGFTNQTHFLLGCGLLDLFNQYDINNVVEHARMTQQIKLLTLPSEMGELFKVMALTRQLDLPLIGFRQDDRKRL